MYDQHTGAAAEQLPEKTPPPVPTRAPPRRRWLRRALMASGALLGLIILALAAVLYILAHLDSPAVKRRLLGMLQTRFGLVADYDAANITPSELHFAGFRLAQAPPDDRSGPPLVAIDGIDGHYSLWSALFGGKAVVKDLSIQGVHLTVFADDDGTTSLSRLVARMPPRPPSPAGKPLSYTLAHLAELPVTVESFRIDGVDAQLVRRAEGKPVQRITVGGLAATLSATNGKLELSIATPTQGAQVEATAPNRHLRADLHLHTVLDAHGGEASLNLTLASQDFLQQAPPVNQVVAFHASFQPKPKEALTTISVDQLELVDGAGHGSLDADLVDGPEGSVKPIVRQGSLELALDRLRGFLPASVGNLEVPNGHVKASVAGLDLSSGARLRPDGKVDVDAALPLLDWKNASNQVRLEASHLALHARPEGDAMAIEAKGPFDRLTATMGGRSIDLSRQAFSAEAMLHPHLVVDGTFSTSFQQVRVDDHASHIALGNSTVKLTLKDARLVTRSPLYLAGTFTAEGRLGAVALRSKGIGLRANELKLQLPITVDQDAGVTASTTVDATGLAYDGGGKQLLAPTTAHLGLQVARYEVDARPATLRPADVRMDLGLGPLTGQAHIEKGASDAKFEVKAKATSLGLLRPFLQSLARDYRIPVERMAMELESRGSVAGLFSKGGLRIDHQTTIRVDHGAVQGHGLDVGSDLFTARLSSHGTAIRHSADATLHIGGLAIDGERTPGDADVDLHATFDRTRPQLDLRLDSKGEAGPQGNLALSFNFDRSHHRVTYSADGHLDHLGVVPAFLPPSIRDHQQLDWKKVALTIKGSGDVEGAVLDFRKGTTPVLARNLLQDTRGTQALDLTLEELHYRNDQGQALDLNSLGVHLDAQEHDGHRNVEAFLKIPEGQLVSAGAHLDLTGLAPTLTVETTDETGQAHLHMTLAHLDQTWYPAYPVGNLTLDVAVSGDRRGSLRIDSAKLANPGGGTTLELKGGLESLLEPGSFRLRAKQAADNTVPGRRDVTITGTLTQQIEALPKNASVSGHGLVSVPFSVESGDLQFFRTTAAVQFTDAHLELPAQKLVVDKLNARIPIKQDFFLDERGVTRVGGVEPNAYPRERFFDYQPFLGSDDFLTVAKIRMGEHEVGPIAGNLRIDRNVIALDQLEMAALGGKIAGQCIIDYDPTDPEATEVLFRGNVTGIVPPNSKDQGELDANAAIRFNPRRMELEGRAEIVRIGKAHLLELLDTWDPYHADVSANRVRQALAVGYPKQVRLRFHQGFAGLSIELGGIASAVGLDDIHGLPTGPLLERYLGPFLGRKEEHQ